MQHVNKIKLDLIKSNNNEENFENKEHVDNLNNNNLDSDPIFTKYISSANEICILNTKKLEETKIQQVIESVGEIMKDDAIIFLLENLNILSFDVRKMKIIKIIFFIGSHFSIQNCKIYNPLD